LGGVFPIVKCKCNYF